MKIPAREYIHPVWGKTREPDIDGCDYAAPIDLGTSFVIIAVSNSGSVDRTNAEDLSETEEDAKSIFSMTDQHLKSLTSD